MRAAGTTSVVLDWPAVFLPTTRPRIASFPHLLPARSSIFVRVLVPEGGAQIGAQFSSKIHQELGKLTNNKSCGITY